MPIVWVQLDGSQEVSYRRLRFSTGSPRHGKHVLHMVAVRGQHDRRVEVPKGFLPRPGVQGQRRGVHLFFERLGGGCWLGFALANLEIDSTPLVEFVLLWKILDDLLEPAGSCLQLTKLERLERLFVEPDSLAIGLPPGLR